MESDHDSVPRPRPMKEKAKKQVPTGGRGGLGNIRARKKSKASSSDNELTNSTSPSSFRFRLPSFESPRRSSVASGSTVSGSTSGSVHSSNSSYSIDSASITAVSGSNRAIPSSSSDSGSISTMSPSPSEIAPRIPLSAPRSVAFPSQPGDASTFDLDSGLPLPGSSSLTSPSLSTSPSSVGSGKTKSKSQTSTSTDYVLHLEADAQQRALEKRLARARAREARLLSGVVLKSPTRTDGGLEQGGGDENTEDKSRVRTGRGGAGVYDKIDVKVDPALHPRSADITRAYEERFVEVERTLIAASRARAAMGGSTGRGGSGNISGMDGKGKIFGKGKSKNGKGKAKGEREVVHNEADVGEDGDALEPTAYDGDEDATLAPVGNDERSNVAMGRSQSGSADVNKRGRKSPGLRGLWRRVRRDGTLPRSQHSPSLSLDETTPRPSLGDEVLHIGRAPSPSYMPFGMVASASSTVSPTHADINDSHKEPHKRTPQPKNEKEGVAFLAFVNSALPDLPRNVLGVPGTPGFPLSGGIHRSPSGPMRTYNAKSSAMTSSIITSARVPGSVDEDVGHEQNSTVTPNLPKSIEGLHIDEEEDWVDDRTLGEADDDTLRETDEEDEDSDIDPQILPSVAKLKRQERDAFRFDNKRPDSLDAIISVALDKLDRLEDTRNDGGGAEEENIIDSHAIANRPSRKRNYGYDTSSDPRVRLSTHSSHSTLSTLSSRPPSEIGEIQRGRIANVTPPVLISAPRYVRASAPRMLARLDSVNAAVKTRTAVPVVWPPPAGPVPALPEHH